MIKRSLTFLLILSAQWCMAQNAANSSTDFWLGCMQISGTQYRIYITSEVNTTGNLSIPQTGFSQPLTILANVTNEIDLSSQQVVVVKSDTVDNKGIHITTNDPVSVFLTNRSGYDTEATSIYPANSLGMDYYAMNYSTGGSGTRVLIGATDNNTTIQATLTSASLGGQPANVPFTFTMNAGEVISFFSAGDLTGSHFNASKPITVFSGNYCVSVPLAAGFCNPIFEQLSPTNMWGLHFITSPLQTRLNGDRFRVLAMQNNTTVTINNTLVATLNTGSFYETVLTTASDITGSSPIAVMQYSHTGGYDGLGLADPFMVTITPIDNITQKSNFFVDTIGNCNAFYSNIISNTANTGLVKLNGNLLGSGAFAAIPGSNYSVANITLNAGYNTLQSDSGFSAIVYGYGFRDAFGFSINNISHANATGIVNYLPVKSNPVFLAPVAFSDFTTIYFDKASLTGYSVILFDITGRTVFQTSNITAPQYMIKRNHLAAGQYHLMIAENGIPKANLKVVVR